MVRKLNDLVKVLDGEHRMLPDTVENHVESVRVSKSSWT